jgi:anti-anti-sigma regulatory factor
MARAQMVSSTGDATHIVLDLEHVGYVDTVALQVLTRIVGDMQRTGLRVTFVGVRPAVAGLFEVGAQGHSRSYRRGLGQPAASNGARSAVASPPSWARPTCL